MFYRNVAVRVVFPVFILCDFHIIKNKCRIYRMDDGGSRAGYEQVHFNNVTFIYRALKCVTTKQSEHTERHQELRFSSLCVCVQCHVVFCVCYMLWLHMN